MPSKWAFSRPHDHYYNVTNVRIVDNDNDNDNDLALGNLRECFLLLVAVKMTVT